MTSRYAGLGCSPGAAVAPGWRPRGPQAAAGPAPASTPADVRAAFAATAERLEQLAATLRSDGAAGSADILEAEALIARDPAFAGDVVELVSSGADAAAATVQVADRHAAVIAALDSAELAERAADVRQVGRMVSDHLAGRVPPSPPPGPVVLLADEVTAPDLLEHAGQVAAAVSVRGGAGSHASIVARSLGVPFLVGVPPQALEAASGRLLLVDGDAAELVVEPSAAAARKVREGSGRPSADELAAARRRPARTRDGADVVLLANVASTAEARRALDASAAGVGLLRTELPFLDATAWPSREQHEAALRPVLEVLGGRPVTVRLLDFTNDKLPAFLAGDGRPSSLDLLLEHEAALDDQLEAVLSAGREADLRVLLPMVASPDQVDRVRARLSHAARAVGVDRLPPLGVMLELPQAVRRLPELLDRADFFSLGTNDLTGAVLGLSRTDPRLTPGLVLHPLVLDLVDRAVRLTRTAGAPLSLCGDAAADPVALPVLLGAGVRVLSVAPSRLDSVRALVRSRSVAEDAVLFQSVRSAPGDRVALVSSAVGDG